MTIIKLDGTVVKDIQHPIKDKIRAVAYHNGMLCIAGDDKQLVLFDKQYNLKVTKTIKKVNKIVLNDKVLVADKFGDVYEYSLDLGKPRLLLGHVSICTDLVLHQNVIITSDRDEKVRISKYPNTFEIVHFLLGHTEFVSRLVCIGDYVLSGGGDEFLCLWDIKTGKLVQKFVLDFVEFGDVKPCVVTLTKHPKQPKIALVLERISSIFILELVNGKISLKNTVKVEHEPLMAVYNDTGSLIISNNSQTHFVSLYDKDIQPLVTPLPPQTDKMFELYETSNIRKWSHWNPTGVLQPPVDEEALHEKKKQKTRRGGAKQKLKKEMKAQEGQNMMGEAAVQ